MAAIMEPLDTQMVDFSDSDDVHMQTSHEIWFQDETLMEDDAQQLHGETQSNSTEYEAVEIDMDGNYTESAENPEYEMIDEDLADYPVGDAEEEDDIIVADVSHDAGGNHDSTAQFEAQSQSSGPSYNSQEQPIQLEQSTSFDSTKDQNADQQEGLSSVHGTPSVLPVPIQYLHSTEFPESNGVQEVYDYNEHDQDQREYHGEPQRLDSVSVDAPASVSTEEHGGKGLPKPPPEPTQTSGENIYPHATKVVISEDQTGTPTQNLVVESGSEQPHKDTASVVLHLDSGGEDQEESLTQAQSATEMAESQHEVENSSVEAPPGILMSLSSDQAEIHLFTQPNFPESSTAATTSSENILFEHNPSLYYEPLSTFFDALRQEETVAHWCDLACSELVIDAYDLQLVISEDNIFSRETSLYDLYQLHEGSGSSGPLRIQLQAVTTRFIVRYRALQEQVYRLSLVEAANEYVEEAESTAHPVPNVSSQLNETEGDGETYEEELIQADNHGQDEAEPEAEHHLEEHPQDREEEETHDNQGTETSDGTLDEGDEREVQEENEDSNEQQGESEGGQQLETDPSHTQKDSIESARSQQNFSQGVVEQERIQDDQYQNETDDHEEQDYQDYPDEHPENTTETDPQTTGRDDATANPDEDVEHQGEYEEDYEAEVLYDANGDATTTDEHVGGDDVNRNEDAKSLEHSEFADADDWDDDAFDEDEGLDTTFEEDTQDSEDVSSHIVLSTKSSKRSIDEVESEAPDQESSVLLDSPGSKRARVE